MPGAFTGTASLTISQMEKMLTVFSPLYELSIFRPVANSNSSNERDAAWFLTKWAHLPAKAATLAIPNKEALADKIQEHCVRRPSS